MRISTKKQSFVDQHKSIIEYLNVKKIISVKNFNDIYSGKDFTKLTNLNNLLEYIEKYKIENIVIFSIDRFGRDNRLVNKLNQLREYVNIHSIFENKIWNSNSTNLEVQLLNEKIISAVNFIELMRKKSIENYKNKKKDNQYLGTRNILGFEILRIHKQNKLFKYLKFTKNNSEIKNKYKHIIRYMSMSDKVTNSNRIKNIHIKKIKKDEPNVDLKLLKFSLNNWHYFTFLANKYIEKDMKEKNDLFSFMNNLSL